MLVKGSPCVTDKHVQDLFLFFVRYVLAMDGPSVHLLVRNAALEDSGSYRWSIFGTQAVARTNVIVAGNSVLAMRGN